MFKVKRKYSVAIVFQSDANQYKSRHISGSTTQLTIATLAQPRATIDSRLADFSPYLSSICFGGLVWFSLFSHQFVTNKRLLLLYLLHTE